MKRKVVLILLVCGVTLALSGTSLDADARRGLVKFRYMAATGLTELAPLCDFGLPCPGVATAASGDAIEISGEGTLGMTRHRGNPVFAKGNGSFIHRNADGTIASIGRWRAKRLLSFEPMGESDILPPNWISGAANILVHMVSDDGTTKANAILEVNCRLPTSTGFVGPDIEGIRLNIAGGPNFDTAASSPTLFIILN